MPFYFAYGSNMDAAAMRTRCPASRLIGPGVLKRRRFALMADGYATLVRDGAREVHGTLYDLALSDVPALDRYECVARGLYFKEIQPVVCATGSPRRALVYVGGAPASAAPKMIGGYMQSIVAAARAAAAPPSYIAYLETFLPRRSGALQKGSS
ncbi:MAG: gamma-glutamylcyclotransferase [Hyphomicrobiales bacterium]|nr:gamma-glutamylcyclotransferase [Hyphomicrobiales bacterium]